MTDAFVYKWTHKPTGKWYIGYHKGDINDGYICSSKIVKPMVENNPEEWERIILDTGTKDDMYKFETSLLKGNNAKHDPMSFNKHNNDGDNLRGHKGKHIDLIISNMRQLDKTQLANIFAFEKQRIQRRKECPK